MIKLPQQPEIPAEPMAEPPMPEGGEEFPPMGGDEPQPMPDNGGNQFDTNFDAGVEADEQTDPKKYIQQLTGKLSQSLRSYNENLPQPDADLDKYVAGMIIKQAISGLSPEDTNDILNKVKGDEGGEMQEPSGQEAQPEQNMDMMPQQNGGETDDMNMGEGIRRPYGRKIDEIFNQVMQDKDDDEQLNKPIKDIGYKKKPFTSPNFK